MDFGEQNESDDDDFGDVNLLPCVVAAKKKWKKLF